MWPTGNRTMNGNHEGREPERLARNGVRTLVPRTAPISRPCTQRQLRIVAVVPSNLMHRFVGSEGALLPCTWRKNAVPRLLWVPKHLMRPGHIRGSGRRAGRAAERGRSRLVRVDRFARRVSFGSVSGAAGGCCSDRRTRGGRAADAVHRRSASAPGIRGGRCRSSVQRSRFARGARFGPHVTAEAEVERPTPAVLADAQATPGSLFCLGCAVTKPSR